MNCEYHEAEGQIVPASRMVNGEAMCDACITGKPIRRDQVFFESQDAIVAKRRAYERKRDSIYLARRRELRGVKKGRVRIPATVLGRARHSGD